MRLRGGGESELPQAGVSKTSIVHLPVCQADSLHTGTEAQVTKSLCGAVTDKTSPQGHLGPPLLLGIRCGFSPAPAASQQS